MSEEIEYGAQYAMAASTAFSSAAAGPVGFAIGAYLGYKAKKAKKKARRAQDALTAGQLVSKAYETGRANRLGARAERSKYAAAGVSTRSGSAQATERATVAESIYQQEAILAGLPKKHHWWKNPMRHIEMRDPGKNYRPGQHSKKTRRRNAALARAGEAPIQGSWQSVGV